MAASLRQDYAKIRAANAELVMISPDSLEEHRKYAQTLFHEELPYHYVADQDLDIARRYGLIRKEEHPHGGYYYRSLWLLDRTAVIVAKFVPWQGNAQVEEYQRLFQLVGSVAGEWRFTFGPAAGVTKHAD